MADQPGPKQLGLVSICGGLLAGDAKLCQRFRLTRGAPSKVAVERYTRK